MEASAIITVHRQAHLLFPTFRNLFECRLRAQEHGHNIEIVVVADRIDASTDAMLDDLGRHVDVIDRVELGDPGKSRNHGVSIASNSLLFFHDADDLYSLNWYSRFLQIAASEVYRSDCIYHGEVVCGFGTSSYFRRQISSRDLYFDPLSLSCQFAFLTNLMVTKDICIDFPIPSHSAKIGIGHDDWSWSCDTLAAGLHREIVGRTLTLYREKEPHLGVGKVPGVIHHGSNLFSRDRVLSLHATRIEKDSLGGAAFPRYAALHQLDPRESSRSPDWVVDEIRQLAAFEPMVTDLLEKDRGYDLLPVRMNASRALVALCELLDEREKVYVFFDEEEIYGADVVIDLTLKELRRKYDSRYEIVIIYKPYSLLLDEKYLLEKFDAKIIDLGRFRGDYRLEDWYFYRFMMRLFMDFKPSAVIDFGSDFFCTMLREFNRPIQSRCGSIEFFYPRLVFDLMSKARQNIIRSSEIMTLHDPSYRVTVRTLCRRFPIPDGMPANVFPLSEAQRARLQSFMMTRLSGPADARRTLSLETHFDCFGTGVSSELEHLTAVKNDSLGGRSRLSLLGTIGSVVTPSFESSAHDLIRANPSVDFAIPQALFWRQADGAQRFHWISWNDVGEQLASLIDIVVADAVNIPIMTATISGSRAQRQIERLVADRTDLGSAIKLLLYLVELTPGKVRPVENTICVMSSHPTQFDASLIVDGFL